MQKNYDCAIIGGGLAGLCLAIQLQTQGQSVALFERNSYPFHKVCGEYISMESWDFLVSLGLPLDTWQLPRLTQLGVSSTRGFMLEAPLALGGFGISRYKLDYALVQRATAVGVTILENCKVQNIENKDFIQTDYTIYTQLGEFSARLLFGAYGKIPPNFMEKHTLPAQSYIGVKYHIKTDMPSHRIELHNFKNGYCGISKVEDDTFCLCYLAAAQNLKDSDNDINAMQAQFLYKNPFLRHIFENSDFIYPKPLTISNISFRAKKAVNNTLLTLGDAAGAIAPLCGNGMSMAMRASKLLAAEVDIFFRTNGTKQNLEEAYSQKWQQHFGNRITAGYYLQQLFGSNIGTHLALKTLHHTPKLLQTLIAQTHGQPF